MVVSLSLSVAQEDRNDYVFFVGDVTMNDFLEGSGIAMQLSEAEPSQRAQYFRKTQFRALKGFAQYPTIPIQKQHGMFKVWIEFEKLREIPVIFNFSDLARERVLQ